LGGGRAVVVFVYFRGVEVIETFSSLLGFNDAPGMAGTLPDRPFCALRSSWVDIWIGNRDLYTLTAASRGGGGGGQAGWIDNPNPEYGLFL